jgi:hypothetical protein
MIYPKQCAGYQNRAMRIYPKGVTPEGFYRGSVPVSLGFSIEAFGEKLLWLPKSLN